MVRRGTFSPFLLARRSDDLGGGHGIAPDTLDRFCGAARTGAREISPKFSGQVRLAAPHTSKAHFDSTGPKCFVGRTESVDAPRGSHLILVKSQLTKPAFTIISASRPGSTSSTRSVPQGAARLALGYSHERNLSTENFRVDVTGWSMVRVFESARGERAC